MKIISDSFSVLFRQNLLRMVVEINFCLFPHAPSIACSCWYYISQEPNQANTEVLICGFYSMSEITNMATDLLRNLSILQEYDRFTSALAVLGGGHSRPTSRRRTYQ